MANDTSTEKILTETEEKTKQYRAFCRTIKDGIHKSIIAVFENTPQYVVRNMKYRDDEKKQGIIKPKIIVCTKTKAELDALFARVDDIIDRGNKKMEAKRNELGIKPVLKPVSYKLKKLAPASPALNLSFTRAHNLYRMTGDKVISWLKVWVSSTADDTKPYYQELIDLFEKKELGLKTDKTPYIIDLFTGSACRITYYGNSDYREQTNVGDILGIYGFEKFTVQLIPEKSRKTRTDINKYIFSNAALGIRIDEYGQMPIPE